MKSSAAVLTTGVFWISAGTVGVIIVQLHHETCNVPTAGAIAPMLSFILSGNRTHPDKQLNARMCKWLDRRLMHSFMWFFVCLFVFALEQVGHYIKKI